MMDTTLQDLEDRIADLEEANDLLLSRLEDVGVRCET